jgi:hypothetical protein
MQEKPVRMSGEIGESQGRPTKITFGEMRQMGVRGVLVYCADDRCGRSDLWTDDMRLSDIEPPVCLLGI